MTSVVEQTSRRIAFGTWGCAGIVMAGSAINAWTTYSSSGDNRALGLATGVAVDIALCVALIGDRRLNLHGLSSSWGRSLRITTALMSLILNVGVALREHHYFMALCHAFLPILLIVLTEYGQDVVLKFTKLSGLSQPSDHDTQPIPRQPEQAVPVQPVLLRQSGGSSASEESSVAEASQGPGLSVDKQRELAFAAVTQVQATASTATGAARVIPTVPVSRAKPQLVRAGRPAKRKTANKSVSVEDVRVCLDAGMSVPQTAQRLECSVETVYRRQKELRRTA